MTCLLEVAIGEDVGASQMHEVCPLGILLGQCRHIVVSTGAERASTECESIVLVGNCIKEPFNVLVAGYDAGQTQNLQWRVVGMHTHIHVPLVADRHNGFEEILHVLAKLVSRNVFIKVEQGTEYLYGFLVVFLDVAVHKALCLDDNVLHQTMFVLQGEHLLHVLYLSKRFGCIIGFGTISFENVAVEVSKLCMVEVKAGCAVAIRVLQVGTRPVEDGHEVITYGMNTAFAQIGQRNLVLLYQLVAVRTAIFNALANREAFHHTPAKSETLDVGSKLCYLLHSPYLTVRNIVKSCYNTFYANLAQHI